MDKHYNKNFNKSLKGGNHFCVCPNRPSFFKWTNMENTKEIWRPVKGYDFAYEVSSFGNVRSLPRMRRGAPGEIKRVRGRLLKLNLNGVGYRFVILSLNGALKTITVHKLVAMTFLNHVPNGYRLIVDHIDNNKLNNHVDNLQIITQRENTSKDRKGGTSKYIGVSLPKGGNRWVARIWFKGVYEGLGYFKNEIDAANAYKNRLKEIIKI